jgi:pyruvate/2-oxoglutarate/acetoin dehydrogenase E1 component
MGRTLAFIEAITEALYQEMERDDRVFILGEDIGLSGGVFKATAGLHEKFGEERVLDTPLAEGIIIAAAIGSSMVGFRPVPEIQFTDFITVAMDQLVQNASKLRYRSAGGYSCPITVRICCGGGRGRRTLPLAGERGVVRARARAQSGDALDALRRQRHAARGHPRPKSGALL